MLDQLGSISLPLLVPALTLHTYGGGIGLNAILPAPGGTLAMLGLYRTQIQASTGLGLVGAGAAQEAFLLVSGASICLRQLPSPRRSRSPRRRWHAAGARDGRAAIFSLLERRALVAVARPTRHTNHRLNWVRATSAKPDRSSRVLRV